MRFFLDANMPYSSLEVFKQLNLRASHARLVGLGKVNDDEIMKYAINNGSILVTKDIEFGNIIRFPVKLHEGVMVLRLPSFFTAYQINDVLKDFLKSVDIKLLDKTIAIIKLGRYRIRKA
ncbi:DUF5615 family PIN-like protein [Candidatus Pacearchaeota archaeon]|nr:DUF5615 family PIN-like protein [Candidatus Pacearchaeota archaeon]